MCTFSCLCVVAGMDGCVLTCNLCVSCYRCVERRPCCLMNLSSNNITVVTASRSHEGLYIAAIKNVSVVGLFININCINGTLVHTFSKHQVPHLHTFSKHQLPHVHTLSKHHLLSSRHPRARFPTCLLKCNSGENGPQGVL